MFRGESSDSSILQKGFPELNSILQCILVCHMCGKKFVHTPVVLYNVFVYVWGANNGIWITWHPKDNVSESYKNMLQRVFDVLSFWRSVRIFNLMWFVCSVFRIDCTICKLPSSKHLRLRLGINWSYLYVRMYIVCSYLKHSFSIKKYNTSPY